MSPWVAAVESIVDGTVSKKEAEVPKGGEISNPHGYPPTRAAGAGWVAGGNFKPAPAPPETRGYAQPVIIPTPTKFNGDRSKTLSFLAEFRRFMNMNCDADIA
jgi:hypothetical protein